MRDRRDTTAFDFVATANDGSRMALDRFRGQVLLVVNVASRCGYTPQYEGLERLYRAYRDQGFAVLAFPCNQFGRQEPGTDTDIRAFCATHYDITFPLFAKVAVNGPETHPLFAYLKAEKKGWLGSGAIKWNFTKFLVGRDGHVIERFSPAEAPSTIEPVIARALRSAPSRAQRSGDD